MTQLLLGSYPCKSINPSTIAKDSIIILNEPESITIDNFLPDSYWFRDKDGLDTIGQGQSFTTDVLDTDTIFYYNTGIAQQAPIYKGGVPLMDNTGVLNPLGTNANIFFKAE